MDPLNILNGSDGIWEKIKDAPHLCASEVLVQGLKKKYRRESFDCLLTVDEFLRILFPDWLNDNNKELARYQNICDLIEESIKNNSENSSAIRILESMKKNPKGVMEAVKYLIESEEVMEETDNDSRLKKYYFNGILGYDDSEKVFVDNIVNMALKYRDEKKDWEAWYPDWDSTNNIGRPILDIFRSCVVDEIRKTFKDEQELLTSGKREDKEEKAINWFRKHQEEENNDWNVKTLKKLFDKYVDKACIANKPQLIVIHGLYRLKAIHFKMISVLEHQGIEVVLLNCYNPQYPEVYRHLEKMYEKLLDSDSPYTITDIIIGKKMESSFKPSVLGQIYGELMAGKKLHNKVYEEEMNFEFYEYETTMDFITSVFKKFEDSKMNIIEDSQSIDLQKVIANMEEQFYGVNGTDLNQIFMIFYPELFKKKSFMSYPAGQFIYYMHDMWNEKNKCLMFKHKGLMECLNMVNSNAASVYEKIKVYIGLDKVIDGLPLEELKNKLVKLSTIEKANSKNKSNNVKHFGYIISCGHYEVFQEAIEDLNSFASLIFGDAKSRTLNEYYINLLNKLENFNQYKNWNSLNSEEMSLVKSIKDRLYESESTNKVTSVQIVKEGIDFYLGHHNGKDINWLVRDFDQIDGDLLLYGSDVHEAYSNARIVHYALVSNQNMLGRKTEFLPWPLSEKMIKNEWLHDILEVISEQDENYRESMFFNGLYYLRPYSKKGKITVRISFIINNVKSNNQESEHSEYFISKRVRESLKIDLKKNPTTNVSYRSLTSINSHIISDLNTGNDEMKIISICPYKYFYSIALGEYAYTYNHNEFQLKRLYQEYIRNVIRMESLNSTDIDSFRKKLKRMSQLLMDGIMVDKEMDEIINYEINIYDRTKTYKFDPSLPFFWKKNVEEHLKSHGISWKNRVDNQYCSEMINEFNNGFTQNQGEEYKISEYFCDNCPQRGLCLYPYRVDSIHILRKNE
jgi:hypothetical protein